MMDEFSGIDAFIIPEAEEIGFAAGVVRGVRSFMVDSLGRLTGVSFPEVWRPGENEARCLKRIDDDLLPQLNSLMNWAGGSRVIVPSPSLITRSDTHAMRDCKHGFYAYYDGSDDYHRDGYVSAVVEGYGETVIGTRGFRSMRARIVALHIPETVKPNLARLVSRNYPDVAVLETFDQMVAEFPPDSAGNEPSPDTDPDFWTRSA